jgi:hypothetical protein
MRIQQTGAGAMASPDMTPIDRIHRGNDGYITFHRKIRKGGEEEWNNLRSVQASKLAGMFPTFAADLTENGYFSLNAFYVPSRSTSRLRWLTCCFVDLDYHTLGLTWSDAVGIVLREEEEGRIPAPSILINSGRGLWCLWILEKPGELVSKPLEAHHTVVMLWSEVQRAIWKRFAMLNIGADAGARDGARVARVPGSINTKAPIGQGRVRYLYTADDLNRPYLYTLSDLAERFGVDGREGGAPVRKMIARAVEDSELTPEQVKRRNDKRKGHRALNELRLEQFEALRVHRGGFADADHCAAGSNGCRNRAALLYAKFLRALKFPPDEVEYHVGKLGEECAPPLSPGDIRAALSSSRKLTKVSDEKISDWLDITPDESRQLRTLQPAARFTGVERPTAPNRTAVAAARRAIIAGYYERTGTVPPLSDLQKMLRERGFDPHLQTISDDLKTLGIANPRAKRKGTPPAPPRLL